VHGLATLRLGAEGTRAERQQLVFSDQPKQESDIDLIIDGLLCCGEDPNFDKAALAQMKLKEPVYNHVFQSWADNPRPFGAMCKRRILDHRKLVEFEEAHDALTSDKQAKLGLDDLYDYFRGCENRQFSKKKTPEFVFRAVQIRNGVLSSLAESMTRNSKGASAVGLSAEHLSEVPLANGGRMMQSVLLNNLQLLKTERLFGLQPTFDLDSLVYSEDGLGRMLNRTLMVLFKESLYAMRDSHAEAILRFVEEQDAKLATADLKSQHAVFKTQFYLMKAKSLLLQNSLEEANHFVSLAYEAYPYNPKIYDYVSEILFRMFLEDESLIKSRDESLIKDFFDSLYRVLLSNYQKHENRVFSVILILFTVYADHLGQIIKTLQSFFSKLPTNFLRVHFYEIALFFNDDVLKAIYERLCQSQLLEFYYILATFHFAVNSENQKTTEFFVSGSDNGRADDKHPQVRNRVTHINMFKGAVDILTNYLPRQIFMLNMLGEMAESVVQETDLDIMMYIRVIIDEAYDTAKANKHLLLKLCNRENALNGPIAELRQEKIPPEERFFKLIQLLDRYLVEKKDRVGQKVTAKELLDANTIFFPLNSRNLLFIDTSNMFEEYRLSPTIKTVEFNDNYALSIDMFSKASKKRKMLVLPKMNQNLIDNLMYDQLSLKAGEMFMNDPRTCENYHNKTQNLLFASRNWYCCLR
jgi:hypothetical protein